MSANNPFKALFELQQGYIKQSQEAFEQAFEQGIEARKKALEAVDQRDLVESGVESLRSVQEEGTRLTQTAADAYFDALEESVGKWKSSLEQARSVVTERLEELDEVDVEQWQQVKEQIDEAVDASDELTRQYIDLFNQSVDALLEVEQRVQENVSEAVETAQKQAAGSK